MIRSQEIHLQWTGSYNLQNFKDQVDCCCDQAATITKSYFKLSIWFRQVIQIVSKQKDLENEWNSSTQEVNEAERKHNSLCEFKVCIHDFLENVVIWDFVWKFLIDFFHQEVERQNFSIEYRLWIRQILEFEVFFVLSNFILPLSNDINLFV